MLNIDEFIKLLGPLIKIPSVIDTAQPKQPFGSNIALALEEVLNIASALGYETYQDPQGYYGYAQIGATGDLFGVLGHVDIVSAGNSELWTSHPYELVKKDDYLIGRGLEDDKGPLVLCMMALKELIDQGYSLNKRVRFILGTDEETMWRCMKAYQDHEEIPSMGFSPDGIFPLVNIEKRLYQIRVSSQQLIDFIFQGGQSINSVPAQARIAYDIKVERVLDQLKLPYEIKGNELVFNGIPAHVMNADEGINAITYLAYALKQAGYHANILDFIVNEGMDFHGRNLFDNYEDELSGKMMFNIGLADFTKELQVIEIDMRIPLSISKEEIEDQLVKYAFKYQLKIEAIDYLDALHVDKNSELVRKLLLAYQAVMKDDKTMPQVSGGATYARAFKNMVAFGPSFNKRTSHEKDERMSIDDLNNAYAIYYEAFKKLVMK
ncbi:MAG: Sapep family Mn(2+)-dependent dipeptidase [Bacilli bacterium]|jgi:predicted dipeptidase|nr:Sapep family Mn(2+)-dependent dipeptidase [Bacilli bacterium]